MVAKNGESEPTPGRYWFISIKITQVSTDYKKQLMDMSQEPALGMTPPCHPREDRAP